jgi:hypothetical protein
MLLSQNRETKARGIRYSDRAANYHHMPEKLRMECVGKTCRAATRVRRLPGIRFPGAGEGIRTPDPLITNQMLYRLSYASSLGKLRLRANLSL